MPSDEENKAIDIVKGITEDDLLNYWEGPEEPYNAIQIVLSLIEKQSKEIEELKEERKSYTEKYIHDNPWLYKQLNEVYMLRTEAEQKERKAYRKGTNDAYELCNKMWKDKIKAKIEFIKGLNEKLYYEENVIELLESLLDKE